jgi:hypothetical protein
MTFRRFLSRLDPFSPDSVSAAIRAGLWKEGEVERRQVEDKAGQGRENYVRTRQPAAVSETGGLRGSSATCRRWEGTRRIGA